MNIFKFLLINLIYFAGTRTAWSFGIGYYTFFRPVVAGMLTGLVLGDIVLGITAGAIVNIVYLDFVSFEDKHKGDPCLTAIITVMAAVILRINSIEALAIAFLLGFTANLIWKYRLNMNTFLSDKFKNNKSKLLSELILPQILLLMMSIVVISICFFIIYLSYGYFDKHYEFLSNLLFLSGIFILLNSIFSNILSKGSLDLVFVYLLTFLMLFFVRSIVIVSIVILLLIYCLADTYKNLSKYKFINKTSIISKSSVLRTWLLWKNFSYFSPELEDKKDINSFNIIKDNIFMQVILSQIFALLCIYFALSENLILLIIFSLLFIAVIIYISYSNFRIGFCNGKEALIQRIVEINKSKLKKYFNLIFSILFMIVIVNLKLKYSIILENNVSSIISILIASILFKVLSNGKIKEYYLIPIIYLIPLIIVLAVPSV